MLRRVAQRIRERRADLMGIALAEGGKVLLESDSEVSEAVDFCEFYARSSEAFADLPGVVAQAPGVVAVIPPWNFPIAIPCGGIVAALAAGNTVIFKPSSDAVLVAWRLCQCFWEAGISRKTLQFLPYTGNRLGKKLISHPDVDFIILTGGTDTGLAMLAEKMRDCLIAQKRLISDPIEIVCGASVKWEYLARIYNVLFGAGLTDITFVMTEQPNNGNFD